VEQGSRLGGLYVLVPATGEKGPGQLLADHIAKHSCWETQAVVLYMHFPLRDLHPDQPEK